jgi:hypothetical protein
MDEKIIDLINRRFVPVKVDEDAQFLASLKIDLKNAPIMFLAGPEGNVLQPPLAASVYPELTFCHLRQGLALHPQLDKPSEETQALLAEAKRAPEARLRLGVSLLRNDFLIAEALLCLHSGDAEGARGLLASSLREFPGHPRAKEARYYLGVACYHGFRQEEEAVQIWRQLAKDAPDSRWGWRAARSVWDMHAGNPLGYYEWLEGTLRDDVAATERRRDAAELQDAARGGCRFLIQHMTEGGWWGARPGENYEHFLCWEKGITPLCYLALHEWRDVLPEERPPAPARLRRWTNGTCAPLTATADWCGGCCTPCT